MSIYTNDNVNDSFRKEPDAEKPHVRSSVRGVRPAGVHLLDTENASPDSVRGVRPQGVRLLDIENNRNWLRCSTCTHWGLTIENNRKDNNLHIKEL